MSGQLWLGPDTRIGTIKAVPFHKDQIRSLFHQDPRLVFRLPDIWLQASEVEECKPPTDGQVERINEMRIKDD